jgi:hypothetical protein
MYTQKTEFIENGVKKTLYYKFTATMPIASSKIFDEGILKSLLAQSNASLRVIVGCLIVFQTPERVFMNENSFEIEVILPELDSQLGCIVDRGDFTTCIELENYDRVWLSEILGGKIAPILDASDALPAGSWGKRIQCDFKELMTEIVNYTLQTEK